MRRDDDAERGRGGSAARSAPQTDEEKIIASGLFDIDHYLSQRPRLARDASAAIADYLASGWQDGVDPGPNFSTRYYLTLNEDVRDAGENPLLHYITSGKGEGRRAAPRTKKADVVAVSPPSAPTHEEWEALSPSGGLTHPDPVVDVLAPVHSGHAETLRCLYSVLAQPQQTPFRLVVINDCSPDPQIDAALDELAGRGLIDLRRNPENLGFVRTCNLGMTLHPTRDVVLLNSDTQVYGDWLDRLHASAYRHPNIATATPFSNNAEICSYPVFCEDNWRKLEVEDEELDGLASVTNRGEVLDIPTGVGFCMYVRRGCLDAIGGFDEANFGSGYGEENDFCRRAAAAGWRNVLAADVFVRHYGGVSFGDSKAARLKGALRTLARLHPDYASVVHDFVVADPARPLREAIDVARLKSRAERGAILFVSHTRGGGTERHVRELAAALEIDGAPVFFCREVEGEPWRVRIEDAASPETVNLPVFDLDRDVGAFSGFLRRIGVSHIHLHNLAAMSPAAVDFMRVAARSADLAYDVTLHDYLAICPRIDLVDRSGTYCGEPAVEVCETCISRDGSPFGKPSVWQWRDRWAELLRGARKVFAPDLDVALRMRRHFPDLEITVRPHAYARAVAPPSGASAQRPAGDTRRIAIIGAIGLNKGSALLFETAKAARDLELPLEFVVVGFTDRDPALLRLGNVSVTGRYPEDQGVGVLQAADAALAWFPAVWPETFSYTLSVALEASVFPVVFNLGAPAHRIRRLGWGAVWPMDAMLDPARNARMLLHQEVSSPPADMLDGLGARGYGEPLSSYYELGGDRRLGARPAFAEDEAMAGAA